MASAFPSAKLPDPHGSATETPVFTSCLPRRVRIYCAHVDPYLHVGHVKDAGERFYSLRVRTREGGELDRGGAWIFFSDSVHGYGADDLVHAHLSVFRGGDF